ncbi:hypothetical protein GNF18_08780 [Ligilactobacillus pobuzihii]|uniref:ABC transporter permease n=1 Tax=Ligilactobacillus pobuzihii TaxID=449659 RepID=UPI0019D30A7A|nr:ABC transporter permease [Ligilactobacillus pobuzihii]MBN7275232.1 hypothetical protein [Ligilactobacillus pobuzihii]
MFRNKTFLTILNACLAFFAVFIFFQVQQRDIVIRLNDHNLSRDTYQVELKQNLTAAQINQKLKDSDQVDDIQVHYRPKGPSKLTYFYGKGSYATTPMISGSFFSKNDFVSDLSVAVVGQNLKSKLYTPKDQAYLRLNDKYVPVIGVMGEKLDSNLDDQIFIAPSKEKMKQMRADQYNILIDGSKELKESTVKSILPVKKIHKSHLQQFVMTNWEWMTAHWLELVGLLAIIAALVVEIFLWRYTSQRFYAHAIKSGVRSDQLELNEWASYSLFNGLGFLAGAFIGGLTFSLQSYGPLVSYLAVSFILSSLLFKFAVKRGIKKIK